MLSDSSTIRDKNCVRLPLLSGPLSILIWMRLVSAFSRWIMVRRAVADGRDRKSTRLNSSHEWTSYAVFCLKKKIGKLSEARTPLAFMSFTRSWTSKQPGRSSEYDPGLKPHSAFGHPTVAAMPNGVEEALP